MSKRILLIYLILNKIEFCQTYCILYFNFKFLKIYKIFWNCIYSILEQISIIDFFFVIWKNIELYLINKPSKELSLILNTSSRFSSSYLSGTYPHSWKLARWRRWRRWRWRWPWNHVTDYERYNMIYKVAI